VGGKAYSVAVLESQKGTSHSPGTDIGGHPTFRWRSTEPSIDDATSPCGERAKSGQALKACLTSHKQWGRLYRRRVDERERRARSARTRQKERPTAA